MIDSTNTSLTNPSYGTAPEPVVSFPSEPEPTEPISEPTEPTEPTQPIGYPSQPGALPTQPASYPVDPETSGENAKEPVTEPADPIRITFPEADGPKAPSAPVTA